MKAERINEIWLKTKELDPDYIVEVLDLSTEEIMLAFKDRMLEFIEDEYEDYIMEGSIFQEGYYVRSPDEEES